MLPAQTVLHFRTLVRCSLLCVALISLSAAQSKCPTGKYASGEFTITFSDNGTHTVSMGCNVMVKGTYAVVQDQITLTDKEGGCMFPGADKYKWKLDGMSLKFEKVEDECEGRVNALTSSTWAKK